jgi:mRNA-degrading endonuclease RelE of RelBE toxin-antitoxin system
MAKTIAPEDLGIEIAKVISEYTEEVAEAVEKEVDETAKNIKEEIQKSSAWKDRTGEYRKGWTIKKENRKGETVRIIYNKDKPGLIHLLEFGHVKRGGGRVAGRPHVQPAYEKYVPQMEQNIEDIIKKGGG